MSFKEFEPFLDPEARVSDRPKYLYKGITDNPKLFTGEAAILLKLLNKLSLQHKDFMNQELTNTRVVPGLYRRHSKQMQAKYKIPFNNISHDEYNGICFMVAAAPELKQHAIEIVAYGRSNNWQINDSAPNTDVFDLFTDNPIDTLDALNDYYQEIKANPHNTNKIDYEHADISSLATIRQPRDICLYKLTAGIKPSFIDQLWLSLAIGKTANAEITEQGRGGTILMAWFRMKAIEMLPTKSKLVDYAHEYFNKKLSKRFGPRYPEMLAKKYFNLYPNHPIIIHIKKYLDISLA